MKLIKQILNVPVLALLLLAIFVGYKVSGTNNMAMQPAVVAVIDIDKLFDGLKQNADAKILVKDRAQRNDAELKKRNEKIESLQAELKDIVDPVKQRKMSDEIGLKNLELKAWFASTTRQAEAEKGALLQELYKKICTEISEMALANGYTLVILDDSNPEVEFNPGSRIVPQLQLRQQIHSNNILYVDSKIDITEQLITRMNNEFIAANAN